MAQIAGRLKSESAHVVQAFRHRRSRLTGAAIHQWFGACGAGLEVGPNAEIHHPQYVVLGSEVRFGARMRLQCVTEYAGDRYQPHLLVGDRSSFENDCHIACADRVIIGSDCLIASNVFISDHRHRFDDINVAPSRQPLATGSVIIEDEVHVGRNVVVMGPVTIGRHSVVGANSVVTHDVRPYSVVAGNPAHIISHFDELSGAWRRASM